MLGIAAVIGALGTSVTFLWMRKPPEKPNPPLLRTPPPSAPATPSITASVLIGRGDTLDRVLDRVGVNLPGKVEMISAIRGTFDVKKFRVGSQLTVTREADGTPDTLRYLIDPDHELNVARSEGVLHASVAQVPATIQAAPVSGIMRGSLFESIERTGEDAQLAMEMASIFAWDLDFYTDPQPGDRFCFLVEKKQYQNGQAPTYGRILAARYENAGTVYEGYLHTGREGERHYYSADGRSLAAAFLRSPLKFDARVSSHFTVRRYHPILKIFRPHLGTDYAAPTGAPVQAVASGTVTFSGRTAGGGNTIQIQHEGGYESVYMHLSRRLVRAGEHVSQGQHIGAVGATGLATGPHLDFRLRRGGSYVNFERFRPPRAARLDAGEISAFAQDRDWYAALMNDGLGAEAAASSN